MNFIVMFLSAVMLLGSAASDAGPLDEARYCGVENIKRLADGSIRRRSDVLLAFRKNVPCPSTKQVYGACPGWSLDHVWPLADGGCDSVINLQWLKNSIKSCAGTECKDRWERTVYGKPE